MPEKCVISATSFHQPKIIIGFIIIRLIIGFIIRRKRIQKHHIIERIREFNSKITVYLILYNHFIQYL